MKRVLLLLACAISIFMLVSCSSPEQRVEEYVKQNRMQNGVVDYVYCETDMVARGTDVVYTFTFSDIDEHTDATLDIIHEYRDMLDAEFEEMFDSIKKEESAVTSLIIEFCETDGDVIVAYVYN